MAKIKLKKWSGGLAEWTDGDIAYLSVAFSWKLPDAYQRAIFYKSQGYKVKAGGPGLFARRNYLSDVAELGGETNALIHHNPDATKASTVHFNGKLDLLHCVRCFGIQFRAEAVRL